MRSNAPLKTKIYYEFLPAFFFLFWLFFIVVVIPCDHFIHLFSEQMLLIGRRA